MKKGKLQAADRQLLKDIRERGPDVYRDVSSKFERDREHLCNTISDQALLNTLLTRLRYDTLQAAQHAQATFVTKKHALPIPIEELVDNQSSSPHKNLVEVIPPPPVIVKTFYVLRGGDISSLGIF
jgi:hypothetical protein